MMSIIQHGAHEILLNADEEEDMKVELDSIIEKSLKKTAELQDQLCHSMRRSTVARLKNTTTEAGCQDQGRRRNRRS